MSRQVIWTKIIVEEFIRLGGLTPDEEHIMRTRAAGYSRKMQSEMFHMSISKIDSIIRVLKIKYDMVQKDSVILPPRKASLQELIMDGKITRE